MQHPPQLGVAKTSAQELIEQADGVAGNSTGRRANALSHMTGLFSANAEGGRRNASLGCIGKPWSRHYQGFSPIRDTPMDDLLYRGHTYAAPPSTAKICVEMTYRQEHYNTCRQVGSRPIGKIHMTYRGVSYIKHRG